ncbi:unnamed protein product [Diamesa tonsa]
MWNLICVLSIALFVQCSKLEVKYSWQELDFAWSSADQKQEALANGKYIPKNNMPLCFDIWNNKIFVTLPRWRNGIPSTLNYFTMSNDQSPLLNPYPNWELNELPNENFQTNDGQTDFGEANNPRLLSVFGLKVDECDRLWMTDSGLVNVLESPRQYAPTSVVIYDLKTNKLIRRFIIPESQVKDDSFFPNIYVDSVKGNCDNSFAYITDVYGYALVVYDYKNNKSWRVKHNYFHFDPVMGNMDVDDVNFQWHDGIFGLALGRLQNRNGDRTVYFHAMISSNEFTVSNRVLKNETYSTSSESFNEFKLLGCRGPNSQSSIEVFHPETDVIFYTQINKDAIGCWNIKKNYEMDTQGLVDSDSHTLVFPNDLKIDRYGNLYVLSNKLPVYMFNKLKPEHNYRILTGKATEIIKGTPCEN